MRGALRARRPARRHAEWPRAGRGPLIPVKRRRLARGGGRRRHLPRPAQERLRQRLHPRPQRGLPRRRVRLGRAPLLLHRRRRRRRLPLGARLVVRRERRRVERLPRRRRRELEHVPDEPLHDAPEPLQLLEHLPSRRPAGRPPVTRRDGHRDGRPRDGSLPVTRRPAKCGLSERSNTATVGHAAARRPPSRRVDGGSATGRRPPSLAVPTRPARRSRPPQEMRPASSPRDTSHASEARRGDRAPHRGVGTPRRPPPPFTAPHQRVARLGPGGPASRCGCVGPLGGPHGPAARCRCPPAAA